MKRVILPLVLLALMSLACAVGGRGQAPAEPAASSDRTPGAAAPALEATQAESTGSNAGYLLADPTAGLDGLPRYTQNLHVSFTGTQNGQPYEVDSTYTRDVWRAANAHITHIQTSSTTETARDLLTAQIGDTAYTLADPSQPCSVQPATPGQMTAIEPAQMLPAVKSAGKAIRETMNGISADHYALTAAGIGLPSSNPVSGDLWLAVSGGYVVKYTLHLAVTEEMAGPGTSGEQVLEYGLSSLGAEDAPVLPKACPAVLTDVPLLPDAADIQRSPVLVDYSTSAAPEEVAAFYQEQYAGSDWIVVPVTGDAAHPAWIFNNTTTNQAITLSVSVEQGRTWVTIQVEEVTPIKP